MRPKIPKCCTLAVEASTGRAYDPKLTLCGQDIPFIGNTTFRFLGAPVSVPNIQEKVRQDIVTKLESMLSRVDASLVTCRQKLRLFRDAICPRLTWDLSITEYPVSWIEKNLDSLITRYLKQWTGLARPANTSRLFLPKSLGGFELPLISTMYKKLQCAKAATLMFSRDPLVAHLATKRTLGEASATRQVFKPFRQVVEAMQEDPGANRRVIAAAAKETVIQRDIQSHLEHCQSLSIQGQTVRQFQDRAAELWAQIVMNLPDEVMRFALNSVTNTLPHNANLHLWGKKPTPVCQLCPERQTLQHVLNHCSVALRMRRYNIRHDDILLSLYKFAASHLHREDCITVDLPGKNYCFPQDVTTTDSRPDLVIWNTKSIYLVELTVPFETGFEAAVQRKQGRYGDLLVRCATTRTAYMTTLEIGSRGFINTKGFDDFYNHLTPSTRKERKELEKEIVGKCLVHSHGIWCKRNWQNEAPI